MYILSNMKAIQVSFDEGLLAKLDATEEVREHGRSAVLRRAVAEYLRRRRERTIAERYEKAYATEPTLGRELEGWEHEGEWPDE